MKLLENISALLEKDPFKMIQGELIKLLVKLQGMDAV
jgi:hypothetical protein